MRRILKTMLIVTSLSLAASCAALPDLKRMQGNMDQMVQYMGVMASCMPHMVNSTSRMANMAETMQGKTDALLANLEKKGPARSERFRITPRLFWTTSER